MNDIQPQVYGSSWRQRRHHANVKNVSKPYSLFSVAWRRSSALGALLLCFSGCGASLLMRPPANTVEELYERAQKDLKSGLYPEALQGFSEVKTRHPYSDYAPLAYLGTADTLFEQGKFIEAIDAYRQFLRLYPSHREGGYAMHRIGEGYAEQLPSDWFFMPPTAEKDQANVRLAIAGFRDMLARFPEHDLADSARERVTQLRRRLADHEMYVAKFYHSRGKFPATVGRAEGILRDYPGLGLDDEALWLAGDARAHLGDVEIARAHLHRLLQEHPKSDHTRKARGLLETLASRKMPVNQPD